ncbi:MAG: hypothetical protein A2758_02930 [Candidatus Zambryskibacteria bacterium RIFCSPHIGHO2_01_FULL_49_18]|uniref:DUF8128 domain-containing protein n=2 Tax=Candidatus Zambryskiibacteriota TaxID=1817925 RepID=A0A1G2T270_9BACT|nr:MAG: hypothetical protein A2758_02930 [Candidatus Zambryskibacteria bacterium RIFCSPHIGHO2_01_FULL_49_18]OHB05028.1 MAG: hypothetical protein A3A26_00425 [Candidatus Zambryskibacteria bacterium RIFCSPLOWO2_01_FULL_47_14]
MFENLIGLFQTQVFSSATSIFLNLWPVWVPLILANLAWRAWLNYVRRSWINSQGYIFLEIRLPKDVAKSPAAMELVLQGIWENANISTPADAFWEGKMREWFSLEIVSIGGQVRFFIWAFPRWRKIIESRVYAQYPEAEIFEAKDYALDLKYDPDNTTNAWGVNTALAKPDAYPIKTYIEYELDKKAGGKPEDQEGIVDPITPVIEYLGSLKPGEVAGIQILIRAHAKESFLYGRLRAKPDWQADIKKEIEKMVKEEQLAKPAEDSKGVTFLNLTKTQTETIASIQRNAGKLAFDTMIRLMYAAPKDEFEKTRGMGIIGSMRQFGSSTLNGIKPVFFTFTHPWQDYKGLRKKERMNNFIDAYKRRAFFGTPHYHLFGKPYILTTEEVATIFHLPGAVATTPSLARAPSKKAEAPANLPV